MLLDPQQYYLSLLPAGQLQLFAGGEAFWQQSPAALDTVARNWLVTEFSFSSDWPQWELHPAGDELVYLLGGAAELWLETPAGLQCLPMQAPAAALIPANCWHQVRTRQLCRMLFITYGEGTLHKAV